MTTTATRTPAVGDPVFFEGLPHRIAALAGDKVEFASELQHEGRPRFRTIAFATDLRWSDELGAWYLWGRLLNKGRGVDCPHCTTVVPHPVTKEPMKVKAGCSRCDQRRVVAELRDRGLLPARRTRKEGQGPAGGEHVNLYCCLFRAGVNWVQEIANVRRGEGLSGNATAAIGAYAERFKVRLTEGYADAGADDSTGEVAR